LIICKAVFHHYVLALDIADLFQALRNAVKSCGSSPDALVPRNPTTGIADDCARAVSGHVIPAPPGPLPAAKIRAFIDFVVERIGRQRRSDQQLCA
jgi:hypothetical protein